MKKFVLVLTVLLILILSAACRQQNSIDGASTTAEPPTVDRQRKASDVADKVEVEFSDKVFGGIYIDDGKVYVNLTEDEFKKLANTEEERDGVKINYKIAPRRPGDIAECYADPEKSKKELGWSAERDLKQMCLDSWNFTKKNPNGL